MSTCSLAVLSSHSLATLEILGFYQSSYVVAGIVAVEAVMGQVLLVMTVHVVCRCCILEAAVVLVDSMFAQC